MPHRGKHKRRKIPKAAAHVKEFLLVAGNWAPIVSGAALLFGALLQTVNLARIDALQFFSYNQVLNDAISFGGIFGVYAGLVLFVLYQLGNAALRSYGKVLYAASFFPLLLEIALQNDFIDLRVSVLATTALLFILLATLVHGLWETVRRALLLGRAFLLRRSSGRARQVLNLKPKRLVLGALWCVYLCVLGFYTITVLADYETRHYLVLVKSTNGKAYVATYSNDGNVFSVLKNGKTLVIPRAQVLAYLYPYSAYSITQGLVVYKPSPEMLEAAFGDKKIEFVVPNVPFEDLPASAIKALGSPSP